MHKKFFGVLRIFLLLVSVFVLLAGCVPSPTATPPRQTPFPTLPLFDGTATAAPNDSNPPATAAPNVTTVRRATGTPRPTNVSPFADAMPPLVQLTVQDPELPVSANQPVALNVLGADNDVIARLELYDNNVLVEQVAASQPTNVLFHQFHWSRPTPGKHTLRAVSFDASGNASAPAEIVLNVITNNRAPGVMITAPSGFKDAEIGAPLLIQGVATDDVAVTRVELIVDNQLITFVKPDQPTTPLAVAIPWTPLTTGSHNIVLRAYDNQNASDDSLRYTVRAFDNQPPVVDAKLERAEIPSGDVLLVEALALANNGIARVELYVDERVTDVVNSPSAAQQTALHATLSAGDLTDGAHSAYVRAYDLTGNTTDSPRVNFTVSANAPRIDRSTPIARVQPTALPPTATPTPPLILPPAPTIQLQLEGDPLRVVLPDPAVIQIRARGDAELDRIELWAQYPGETTPQLLLEEIAKGATDKTLTFNWNAPRAGIVELRARVFDDLGQSSESARLRFTLQAPDGIQAAPQNATLDGMWLADSPAARFEAAFTQTGRALRGVFVEKRADGKRLNGRIVSGAVGDKIVLFAVDFAGDALDPRHTLTFDCAYKTRPPTLTCNFTNEFGERGSAVFTPLGQK
jgi:hypothetical protein